MPSAPLLGRPVSSPCMHAGVLMGPGRERWATRTAPARRLTGRITPGSAKGQKEDEATRRSHRPRTPDPRGERVRPPDSAPYHDPSFSNTDPPSRTPQHDEDTRSPVYLDTLTPLDTLFLYFCWIKSSPRPDATPTVSVVCSSRHTGGECGQGGA